MHHIKMWCNHGRVMGIALVFKPSLNKAALCLVRVFYIHRLLPINHESFQLIRAMVCTQLTCETSGCQVGLLGSTG